MKQYNKRAMAINIAAQCVLYISVLIFSVTNIMDITLPDAALVIICVLDVLTIPAFMYAYVKSLDNKNNQRSTTEQNKSRKSSRIGKLVYAILSLTIAGMWFFIFDNIVGGIVFTIIAVGEFIILTLQKKD